MDVNAYLHVDCVVCVLVLCGIVLYCVVLAGMLCPIYPFTRLDAWPSQLEEIGL